MKIDIKSYKNLYGIYSKKLKNGLTAAMIPSLAAIVGIAVSSAFSYDDIIFTVIMFVTLLFFGAAIVLWIRVPMNNGNIYKSLSRFTPEELERLDRDILSAPNLDGLGVTQDAVFYTKGRLFIYPLREALWIYRQEITTTVGGFIPAGKDAYTVICGMDGKRCSLSAKLKGDAVGYLQSQIGQYRRGVFFGYSDDTDKMYRRNIGQMIAVSEEYDRQFRAQKGDNVVM